MNIYFEDSTTGGSIDAWYNVSSIPFKEGDRIYIDIINKNKDIWNIEEFTGFVEIKTLDIEYCKSYPSTNEIDKVRSYCDVFVSVKPLKLKDGVLE